MIERPTCFDIPRIPANFGHLPTETAAWFRHV